MQTKCYPKLITLNTLIPFLTIIFLHKIQIGKKNFFSVIVPLYFYFVIVVWIIFVHKLFRRIVLIFLFLWLNTLIILSFSLLWSKNEIRKMAVPFFLFFKFEMFL